MSAESVLIECLDSHGRVSRRERVAICADKRTFTIGRSMQADVILDDDQAAPLHAALEITPQGRILASDLGSINGIIVAGKRHRQACALALADNMLQIGRTRLRVRTAQETLAPEKPDRSRPASLLRHPAWVAGAGALAVGAQMIFATWISAPRDLAEGIVFSLSIAALVVAAWVAFWALLSRVMVSSWRWLHHAAIFLGVSALFAATDDMLDLGWSLFALPPWGMRVYWLGAVALGCTLLLHLMHASSLTFRRAALVACIVPALLGGTSVWLLDRTQGHDVNHIDADLRIYPPALRLRASGDVGEFLKGAAALRQAADRKRAAVKGDESEDD